MTTGSEPVLGLPGDIDADIEAIRTGADELDGLRLSLTGQTEETDARFRSAAGEFTELLAWNIGTAAAEELMLWEDTTRDLTYGASSLRQWAQDIENYRSKRASVERRFDAAMAERILDEPYDLLREELLEEHRRHWETLMSQAEEAVDSLRNGPSAEALERMASTGFLTGAQLSYFGDSYPGMLPNGPPSQDDPPSTVNAWWTSMSEKEQQQAIEDHPELLRALDGIPSTVRDKLNRDYLDEEITRLEEEIEELEQENEERKPSPTYRSDDSVNEIKIDKLQEQLDILIQLEFDLDKTGPTHHEERFLLSLDTDGQGRAIVAHGNPDTADNVATLVPGTTTDWQSIEEQANRGQNLAEVAHRVDENADHSVISWIGYDAPQHVGAGASFSAQGAVDEISNFQEALRVTHQGTNPSHNTVLGHSYGSTVIGEAAVSEQGLNADNLVFVGSPGVGVEHAEHLGLPSENIYATQAENDGIESVTYLVHGPDPTDNVFGATAFDSNEGSEGGALFGYAHSEYFQEENISLDYMGHIIAGIDPPEGWTGS